MSHKVHPKIFRLKKTTDWDSRWITKRELPEYLEEDFEIRKFLEKRLQDSGIDKIEIERFPGKINVVILSARPGLIIGRGGKGVEKLKKELEEKILKKGKRKELKLEITSVKDFYCRANLVGQWIARQLEKRVAYRRAIKQALSKIMAYKEVKGARIEVAGRLNGAEIARREWVMKGQLPRQTLRTDIDYGDTQAHCSYGIIGIKVWVYKGEKF